MTIPAFALVDWALPRKVNGPSRHVKKRFFFFVAMSGGPAYPAAYLPHKNHASFLSPSLTLSRARLFSCVYSIWSGGEEKQASKDFGSLLRQGRVVQRQRQHRLEVATAVGLGKISRQWTPPPPPPQVNHVMCCCCSRKTPGADTHLWRTMHTNTRHRENY